MDGSVLARLKQAEAEAARLRTEMASLESERQNDLASRTPAKPSTRIDGGGMKRETLSFGSKASRQQEAKTDVTSSVDAMEESAWLSEKMTGGGPGEQVGLVCGLGLGLGLGSEQRIAEVAPRSHVVGSSPFMVLIMIMMMTLLTPSTSVT